MKTLVQVMIAVAIVTLVVGVIEKYIMRIASVPGTVAGVGPGGYLIVTIVLLLLGANFALLELLKKK